MSLRWPVLALAFGAALVPVACGGAAADVGGGERAVVAEVRSPIANFVQVRDGLYRGGHPDEAGLDYLRAIGVKTILDLEVADLIEAMPSDISSEVDGATRRGMTVVREPMSAFEPALSARFDARIDAILGVLGDRARAPVYVHCKHGQDRTGLVIGLERVFLEKWPPKDAYAEMRKIGFHPFFIGLREYFERKTGWED